MWIDAGRLSGMHICRDNSYYSIADLSLHDLLTNIMVYDDIYVCIYEVVYIYRGYTIRRYDATTVHTYAVYAHVHVRVHAYYIYVRAEASRALHLQSSRRRLLLVAYIAI